MILKNLIAYMLAWNLKIVLHSFKIELKPSLVLKKKGHVFVLFYLSYVIPYIQLLFGPFLNVVWIFWGFALWWLNPLLLGVKNYYKYNLLKAFWWSSAVHSQAQFEFFCAHPPYALFLSSDISPIIQYHKYILIVK